MTDTTADLLTRLRNAARANKAACKVPSSRFGKAVLDALVREGYIDGYTESVLRSGVAELMVNLRYFDGRAVFERLDRVSKPGRRVYNSVRSMPRVNGGLGVLVLSTSRGVLSDREALKLGVGGEIVCRVC